jgi:zinc protease
MRVVTGLLVAFFVTSITLRVPAESPIGAKDGPVAKAVAALYEGIREETLPNGLRVYLKPIPEAPTVTVMTVYCVGSADEEPDHTGLSHYLEHLMFKGTDKLKPGAIDRLTRQAGGQNNAYTTNDFTNFHFDFAADRWEVALSIEADRMRHLRIDEEHEFEQEKGAVINELLSNEDDPYELENKAILPLLFGAGTPYGHPIIGEQKHVEQATAAIIKSHYDKWYHPNNARLVIVGGFDPDRAMTRIKELFGPIPKAELPARRAAPPVNRTKPESVVIQSKFDVDRCVMGFNTCKVGEPDDYVLDVIEHILSSGKTGRLYRRLVLGQEVAGEVKCTNQAGKRPGWFSIEMEVMKGVERKKAEKALLAEFEKLATEPVSPAEMRQVVRSVVAGMIFQREGMHELADGIVNAVATTDLDYIKTYLSKIQGVTTDDVMRVSKKYFNPEKRVVVWSVAPQKSGEQVGLVATHQKESRRHLGRFHPAKEPARASAALSSMDLTRTTRTVLDNGLTLLLLENHRLPIVFAEASVGHVRLYEPENKAGIVSLIGLLLEEGTDKHDEKEIAQAIENVGGVLNMAGSGGSVKVLSPDRSLGLGLMLECLTRPAFTKNSVNLLKKHMISEIDDNELVPQIKAQDEFLHLIYGRHPLGRSTYGTKKSVESITEEDCHEFHDRIFVPNNTTLAVVGDFDSKALIAEITDLTKGWKKRDLPKLELPEIEPLGDHVEKTIPMPDAAQLNVYMGHLGITRTNPDYYKLLVMDNILGVGTGFTDRLSSRLRDRQGLAYTVTASITSTAGEQPGVFTAFIGIKPQEFGKVKTMMMQEFNRIREEKPTPDEVKEAKGYLVGAMPFKLATNEDLAAQLILIERYHLGLDYLQKFKSAIESVTVDDVHAVARKYLHPDQMAIVAAGPLDKQGKPDGKRDKRPE